MGKGGGEKLLDQGHRQEKRQRVRMNTVSERKGENVMKVMRVEPRD